MFAAAIVGSNGLSPGLLVFGLFFVMWAALQNARRAATGAYIQQSVSSPTRLSRAELERAILKVADRNDGRVTPAQVVMSVHGVDLTSARQVLSDLAANGYCVEETDASGRPAFSFAMGESEQEDISAEEWVNRHSTGQRTRMSGQRADDSPLSVDD